MSSVLPAKLTFGAFELDLTNFELYRAGALVAIQKKPLDLLTHLVRHEGRVVPKEELLREVWPEVRVSRHALNSALRDLRHALRGTETAQCVIVTVRGRGYRFLSLDARGNPDARKMSAAPAVRQLRTRYDGPPAICSMSASTGAAEPRRARGPLAGVSGKPILL